MRCSQRLGLISRTGENSGSTFWVELPFGVGAKTFKGLPSSQQTLLRTPSKRLRNPARPTTSDAEESSKSALMRKSSALHRIMDQAGMFELLPDGDQLMSGSMITRTLGDVSTGTAAPDAVPASLDESVAATPKRPALQGREQSSETTIVGTPVRDDMNIPMMSTSDTSASGNTPASGPVSTTEDIKTKADPSPSSSSTRLDVLVVDDDPLTRTLMKRMLTRLGCSVTTAENGELGLELILGRPVDDPRPAIVPRPRFAAVFLDNQYVLDAFSLSPCQKQTYSPLSCRMPIMTGVEAVARLRSEGRDDLVIGVTGNALLSDQEEYLAAGVDQ
jgi:osomolarity two-component system sensor histidine kinase SLN1